MTPLLLAAVIMTSVVTQAGEPDPTPLRLGVFADPQFAEKPTAGSRRFREADEKLEAAVAAINDAKVHAAIHLGDAIDGDKDADAHLARIFGIMRTLQMPLINVVGNHCLDGGRAAFDKHAQLSRYYSEHDSPAFRGWRIIALDGNDISTRDVPDSDPRHERASAYLKASDDNKPWNGAIGEVQMVWLENTLADAQAKGQHVLVLCHFPICVEASDRSHVLWNHDAVLGLLQRFTCVKAVFAGHDHRGGYAVDAAGIHHVTFPAMCDAPDGGNAYAFVTLTQTRITITGVGSVPSRELTLR